MNHKPLSVEIAERKKRGVLLVLTGPVGSGKDALFARLIAKNPSMVKVATTTSRKMRQIESEGNPYHFISREEFRKLIADGEFFEWVEFRGELYGTRKKTISEALSLGKDVIWHIEEKGIKNNKAKIKEMIPRSVFVFLTAPEIEDLRKRVLKDEGKSDFLHRWNESLVLWEIKQYNDCDYVVVNKNGKLEEAVGDVLAIMDAKRLEVLR